MQNLRACHQKIIALEKSGKYEEASRQLIVLNVNDVPEAFFKPLAALSSTIIRGVLYGRLSILSHIEPGRR